MFYMHKSEGLLLFVLGLLLAPASLSYAQSVTVQPAMPFVGVGQTVQFSAQITGLTNTAVTWSAGGMVGGNSTAGAISSTGLYTAPTNLPGKNPVQIIATSVASPTTKGLATLVAMICTG